MKFMSKMEARDAKVDKVIQAQQTTIQNLERQVGQLAKAMSDREKGKLPSTPQVNPRESVMAISLRSAKVLEEPSVGEKPQVEKGENVVFKV